MEAHDLESQLPTWVDLGKHLNLQMRITTMSCMRIQWRHRVARRTSEVLTEALGEPMPGRARGGEVKDYSNPQGLSLHNSSPKQISGLTEDEVNTVLHG